MEARTGDRITPPILVTGGTGTIGRLVVVRLRDAGRDRSGPQPRASGVGGGTPPASSS